MVYSRLYKFVVSIDIKVPWSDNVFTVCSSVLEPKEAHFRLHRILLIQLNLPPLLPRLRNILTVFR